MLLILVSSPHSLLAKAEIFGLVHLSFFCCFFCYILLCLMFSGNSSAVMLGESIVILKSSNNASLYTICIMA